MGTGDLLEGRISNKKLTSTEMEPVAKAEMGPNELSTLIQRCSVATTLNI